jgi:predicted MFS family arabinose efflux permease
MFRWVLGFGGSGIYSIATLVFFELVPPSKYADYVALVTAVIALSVVSGPLLGGAISSHGRWRWVFLLKSVSENIRCECL